ncbi:PREDICTED: porimin-like [Eufriesea mexicana]|uniref:porimin-like n=1 Tax=Eufriesea mexicana TaxID=516756 RepID=UPI00083BF2B0|nr:PREDICTED: porimin-like [Eufriesea mexicana]
MRLVYITCILFATTICCIANDNAGTTQGDTKSTTQQTLNLVNDTVPIINSTSPAKAVNTSTSANTTTNAIKNITTTTTDIVSPISTDATTVATNVVSNKTTNDSILINDHKLEPNGITTTTLKSIILTTLINSTTISEKAKNMTTVIPTIPNDTSNVTSTPVTPVVPVSKVTFYKGRHFDGLSFFGGIILATCLVAIMLVSNKLYKALTEQNYHTL